MRRRRKQNTVTPKMWKQPKMSSYSLCILYAIIAVHSSLASMVLADTPLSGTANGIQQQQASSEISVAQLDSESVIQQQLGAQMGGSSQISLSQQQMKMSQQGNQNQLPNINIYISRNEIKKLLGIDSQINYIHNGNLNSYPLEFAIPLGYNESDIIFTWQNLGPTNVNYSISLIIANPMAVEMPIINITRNGLIPRQEQVFKITLPCSGKLSDEVDVQVLINISGFVPVELGNLDPRSAGSSAPGSELTGAASPSGNPDLAPNDRPDPASSSSSAVPQSAEMSDSHAPSRLRQVSHILAVRRKKICTQRPWLPPTPSTPAPQHQTIPTGASLSLQNQQKQLDTHAQQPDQMPPKPEQTTRISTTPAPSKLPGFEFADSMPAALNPAANPTPSDYLSVQHQPPMRHRPIFTPPDLHEPVWPPRTPPSLMPVDNSISLVSASVSSNRVPSNFRQSLANSNSQQPPQLQSSGASNPLLLALIALSLVVSIALIILLVLGFSSGISISSGFHSSNPKKISPFDKLNRLVACISRRNPSARSSASSASPTLGVNRRIRSFGIDFGINLDASNGSSIESGASKSGSIIQGALDLRPPSKLSISTLSALSNGNHHTISTTLKPSQQYCLKSNGSNNNSSNNNSFPCPFYPTQNSQYSYAPTADLLGTGYQAYQSQQAPQLHPNMYQQLNTHTTRLVWQQPQHQQGSNGSNTSANNNYEAGFYMPLSQTGRSDSGSLYQTIY